MDWLICRVWEWILVHQINEEVVNCMLTTPNTHTYFYFYGPISKEPHAQIEFQDWWADSQSSQHHPRKEADINGSPGTWDKLTNGQRLWLKLAILDRIRRQKLTKSSSSWHLKTMYLCPWTKEYFNWKLDNNWSGNMGRPKRRYPIWISELWSTLVHLRMWSCS